MIAIDPTLLFHAVSDGTRLRLLRLLGREELNVQELVAAVALNQPRVSKHLAVLRDAGWIQQRREGTWSWYRAVPAAVFSGGEALHAAVTALLTDLPERTEDEIRLAHVIAEREARGRDFFAGVADDWDRIRRQYEHPDLQTGVVAALVPPDLRVADIGTGTGALLPGLAAAAREVVAVDHSSAMLTRARRLCADTAQTNVHFQQADVRALPFGDASFDAAYCSMVLHHLSEPLDAVRELARITRPGGTVVLIEFTRHNLAWMRDELDHRWLGFADDDIARWFAATGLVAGRRLVRKRTVRDDDDIAAAAGREPFTWPDVFMAVATRESSTDTTTAPWGAIDPKKE